MKAQVALIFVCIIISVSIIISPTSAQVPSVGVKEGDWIEYKITITGTGQVPPTHDVRWMKIQVLEVNGPTFSVNLTARYANGTIGSAIWNFNFTEGNVGGWIIIPSNLSSGETFFDLSIHNNKPVNVTIQSEEQETVLGATRTLTFGNDTLRHKQWDKATGVFVWSSEVYRNVTTKTGFYIDDLTVKVEAAATNMWIPQGVEIQNQTLPYTLTIVGAVGVVLVLSSVFVAAKRKKLTLNPLQGKVVTVALLAAFVVMVGAVAVTPLSESQVPLSFRDINLLMQTLWLTLLLVSMWFRKKGNFFVHGILMILVVTVTLVSFSGVLVMSPPNPGSMGEYFGSPVDIAVFLAHGVFSIPAIAFGVWLVALWRPNSATFAARSHRAAQLTTIFWVVSYVVGIMDFLLIRNALFA
jgi:uncharacterized membrane protein YozB (DUF420 family)